MPMEGIRHAQMFVSNDPCREHSNLGFSVQGFETHPLAVYCPLSMRGLFQVPKDCKESPKNSDLKDGKLLVGSGAA